MWIVNSQSDVSGNALAKFLTGLCRVVAKDKIQKTWAKPDCYASAKRKR